MANEKRLIDANVLMDVYTYKGDNKWEDTHGYWNYTDIEGISHWMPLSEPPKGE